MRQCVAIAAAAAFSAVLCAAPALAQSNRTFVSGKGSDSNPCSATMPCRGFSHALSVTNPGGEITVLDSAGYGSVTIDRAVTIDAPDGIEAGVTPTGSGDGITVNAPGAVVSLRGLTLLGGGTGGNGITLTAASALDIQRCTIRGFTGDGLHLFPTAAANISVTDTVVANNAGFAGIRLSPSSGTTASFNRVQATGNSVHGIAVEGSGATATATDSLAVGNTQAGFLADVGGNFTVARSESLGNGIGIIANTSGTVTVTETAVFGNTAQYESILGTINTFGNNYIVGQSGNLTSIGPQ